MSQGDACTCDGPWGPIDNPLKPPKWMQDRATAILDAGHPTGYEVAEEGPDGNCYLYVREQHPPHVPPEPPPYVWHPGVSVKMCRGKAKSPPQGAGGAPSPSSPPSPPPESPPDSSPPSSGDTPVTCG